MEFIQLQLTDEQGIREMSAMAEEIVREHFDPLIGKEQNDYMISLFQTPEAVRDQLMHGYRYYFVLDEGRTIGFTAFYPKAGAMYLSKFYLYRSERGKGCARQMLEFIKQNTLDEGLKAIELNVNRFNMAVQVYERLGFHVIRTEKKDIGHGYYMDDYVFRLDL
ncbi:MAG: GNAT family N-acetyltransferase [Solobacterium sp.]|nr:GNAT family N-acetyltransferase [Solobacterium sp.]